MSMAACGFGASSLKLSRLNLGCVNQSRLISVNYVTIPKSIQCQGVDLVAIQRAHKALYKCQCSVSDTDLAAAAISEASTNEDKRSGVESKLIPKIIEASTNEDKCSGAEIELIPNPLEVESLVTMICDTPSIAEVELKLEEFRLHVTRLSGQTMPSPPSQSLAVTKPGSSSYDIQSLLDRTADEGLKILTSPMVGYFRRSRAIKGKRAAPSCKEKQEVKEGQVLCYIEQLGSEIPLESDASGEVIRIFCRDGDPVGYGDPLLAILPAFEEDPVD